MPTYDYACSACGHRFEVVHGVHGSGPETCPNCGGGPVRKAFAPPTVLFKGSGWAKMDRRSTAAAKPAKGSDDGAKPATDKTGDAAPAASTTSSGDAAAPASSSSSTSTAPAD